MIKLKQILESPHKIESDKHSIYLYWGAKDSRAFGYYNNELYLTNDNSTHGDVVPIVNTKEKVIDRIDRDDLIYPGRIWLNKNVCSFWDVPKTKSEFDKFIKDMQQRFYEKEISSDFKKFKFEIFFDEDMNVSFSCDADYQQDSSQKELLANYNDFVNIYY